MVVQHNIPAMNANRYFGINNSGLSKSLEKLSSGYAINRAGDNAAGLAVSEKMRSQIAGLTQGVKNAQDGISMIQTYEGALTETDSILQRMKTLADQAANGTYQDDVDRDAIQLEFNQLNDELDQIADTDFNGVVVLNGGQMADGTKAINGKFDYENGAREAKQLGSADVKMLDSQQFNDTKVATGEGFTKADSAWKELFGSIRDNASMDDDGPEYFEATFQYDSSKGTWSAIKATNGADKANLTVTTTDNGGFSVKTKTGGIEMSNVTMDKSTLVNGDTITIRYNNPATVTMAPSNATAEIANSTLKGGSSPTAAGSTVTAPGSDGKTGKAGTQAVLGDRDANLIVDVNKSVTMTQDVEDLLKLLENATVTGHYSSDDATDVGDMTINFADPGVAKVNNAADATRTIGTTEFTFASSDDGITIKDGAGKEVVKLSMTKQTNSDAGKGASGDVTWNIQFAQHAYDNSKVPSTEIVDDESKVSIANSNNYATAPLTYTDHVVLQAGARTKDSVDFTFKYSCGGMGGLKANMNCSSRADGLGTANLKLTDQKSANYAIDRIDNAINKVSMVRATFGAVQNRLEHKIDNMNVTKENITSAESRIRDTNMAEEMTNFTKNQILSQASQAMLAQANQLPQGVLQLLG